MQPTHIFTNGCSFLTTRPKEGVMTHVGMELGKLMKLKTARHFGAGGRGNKRLSISTKVWCERNTDLASKCFFVIGVTSGMRYDFPITVGYKKHKFPELYTFWKTYKPWENKNTEAFFKHLDITADLDLEQMAHYESLEATLNLQNYFKLKNYPYVMYKTLPDSELIRDKRDFKYKDIYTLRSLIDKERYFKPNISHLEYTEQNNQHCAPDDHHPSPEGHRDWATQLKDFIDANDLRTI
jgi:hypothetical protein|tara:strand:- start:8669 stop:9385 length:717 start_codon:yes stop_codon:yes gene_type:complete